MVGAFWGGWGEGDCGGWGSLKGVGCGDGKSGYGGDTPCSVSGCIDAWGSLKRLYWVFRLPWDSCLLPKYRGLRFGCRGVL